MWPPEWPSRHRHKHLAWWLHVRLHHIRHYEEDGMIPANAVVGQSGIITVSPIPSNGTIDAGSVKYASDSPAVTLIPSVDGLSCQVQASAPGVANITVSGTSLGNPIPADNSFQITVTNPPATGLHVAISNFA